jgi:hypothetical protein
MLSPKWVPCHHGMAHPQFADAEVLQIWINSKIISNGPRTADKRWSSSLRVGRALKNPHRKKNQHVMKCYTVPRTWRALVNTGMNLWVPQKLAERL